MFRFRATTPTKRELRVLDVPIPETMGVASFQELEGKSFFLIDGTMYANNESNYYLGRRKLRKLASLEIQQADPASDFGFVPYTWTESGVSKQIFVKIQYVDGLGESARKGFKLDFRFLCEIKYPTIFDVVPISAILGDPLATVTGSSAYSWIYPIIYGKSTYTSNGAITNPGDLGTYPSFVVFGPINQPKISNVTTGESITVATNLATTSDSMIIAYDQDTPPSVTIAGNSVYGSVVTGSTFFKLKPGINSLALTGASVGTGAYATVSALPAYPMS